MRKLFAIALAVVMLACVFAAIPAAAASRDGSTAADVPALIVTEIMANAGTQDAYEYIEIYNRGDVAIDLYDLALARAPYYKSQPATTNAYHDSWNLWQSERKFQSKMDFNAGAVAFPADFTELASQSTNVEWSNPGTATIAPHSFAIIWVLRNYTLSAVNKKISDDFGNEDPDLPRTMFREKFNTPANVPIIYVWGNKAIDDDGNVKTDEFDLDDCKSQSTGYMYGIVSNTFDLANDVVYATDSFNAKVLSLCGYGANQTMHTMENDNKLRGYVYVPADQVPELHNRKRAREDADYVAGNYVETYRQVGLAHGGEDPTAGTMPAYQWAYVDPDNAPASVTSAGANWGAEAIHTWAEHYYPTGDDDSDWDGRVEEKIEVNPPTQAELQEKFFGGGSDNNNNQSGQSGTANAGNTTKDGNKADGGLPTGALIGIIVGGVVIAAAIVVTVIIVLKKKKAAPAVEVPVEDAPVEAPVEEAPAEAPAEEAPAEEEKKEE